jgi:hypothetical protein
MCCVPGHNFIRAKHSVVLAFPPGFPPTYCLSKIKTSLKHADFLGVAFQQNPMAYLSVDYSTLLVISLALLSAINLSEDVDEFPG